ncbi:MAG TPA: lysine--tRNA ligase [Anaerolineaceae bacterium]|uniref:Lysine--tRNA ligase n=1 Tax=Anaerolinea thermophila TaxID=167964 RepID=A0A124FN20_9CHLR|nr:MAG: Lysine--tRNA ligase [Anaerolinea thermophila]HAF61051.1 lysine--tRNA ligase [Anaerolineaceae bacterium]
MDWNELEKIRLAKVEAMRSEDIEPYPTRSEVDQTIKTAIIAFEDFEKQSEPSINAPQAILAGRIRSKRVMGKLAFCHIEDSSGRLQLMLRVNEIGQGGLKEFDERFDLGDFIQAGGSLMRSRTGEITLLVSEYKMLAKAITPLPAAKDEIVDGKVVHHATLSDPETRYRQRYADLAVNDEARNIFRTRTAIIRALQRFLDKHDFIEVETPILQPIYGGAAARPFSTFHNQLHQELFLRISFELYLKRLLVGGFDRVYEIGRDFRNEGVSFKHNPEFTQLEFYMAYADYEKIMGLTEQMLATVCDEVLGKRTFIFDGQEINMDIPWRRVELRQGILEATGVDIYAYPDAEALYQAMQKAGLNPKEGQPRGKLIDSLIGDFLEPNCIQPTFLYDYPRDISPLAKNKPGNPQIVERFEGFVGGMELCNAFTELNDPLEQEKRFAEMGRTYDADDEENHPMDEDYLQAMSFGMPPSGGFGMGIDRLTMLLTGNRSIREVILFPYLRDIESEE